MAELKILLRVGDVDLLTGRIWTPGALKEVANLDRSLVYRDEVLLTSRNLGYMTPAVIAELIADLQAVLKSPSVLAAASLVEAVDKTNLVEKGPRQLRAIFSKLKRAEQFALRESLNRFLGKKQVATGSYRIVYADPPWRFRNWSMEEMAKYGEKWARRNGRSPYTVMTTDDISAMPINKISARDSVCLLWATYPKLQDALQVLQAWGFDFVTVAFTWVKLNPSGVGYHFGLGYYTRQNPEIVLLGRRGKGVKRIDNSVPNLVISPRGQHSAKPVAIRDSIVRLFGDKPRVELFARNKEEGWDAWGNQVEATGEVAALADFLIPPIEAIVDDDEAGGLGVEDTKATGHHKNEQLRF